MNELAPLIGVMLGVLCVSAAVAVLIVRVWRGRGLVYSYGALGLVLILWMAWFAIFGNFSTGMEGLAFIIWTSLYGAVCFGALVGYAIFRTFKRD